MWNYSALHSQSKDFGNCLSNMFSRRPGILFFEASLCCLLLGEMQHKEKLDGKTIAFLGHGGAQAEQ
jgi:hypothetical protein